MIAMQTVKGFSPTGLTAHPATSAMASRVLAPVSPRLWGELCPQAAPVAGALAVLAPAADRISGTAVSSADLRVERSAEVMTDKSALIETTQHFGSDKQYGNTPHHSGTRVRKHPI